MHVEKQCSSPFTYLIFKANSENCDQMPRSVAFDLVQHSLPRSFYWMLGINELNCNYTMNPLYNDNNYSNKIRYNVSLGCRKVRETCIF